MNPRKKRILEKVCIWLSVIGVTACTIVSCVMLPYGWDLAVIFIIPVEALLGAVLVFGIKAAFQARRFRDGYLDLMSYMAAAGIVVIELALSVICLSLAAFGLASLRRGRRSRSRGGSSDRMSSGYREVFRIADEQRAVSEDIEQWVKSSPGFVVTDHYDWFEELCAKTDGYID